LVEKLCGQEKHKDEVYINVDGGQHNDATMVTAAGAGCRDMLAFIQRKTTQRYTRQMVMVMRMMKITGLMWALMTD
jgi:hypothetical protein